MNRAAAVTHRVDDPTDVPLGRWVAAMTVAEGVGFLFPTAGFALTVLSGAGTWVTYVTLVLAGAMEGSFLGLGQAWALSGTRAGVPRWRWTAATATGAALAWMIGMLPSTVSDLGAVLDVADPRVLSALIGAGLVLLATIPTAQWTVLRRTVGAAWRWIPLNMAAWSVGLVFTFLPSIVIVGPAPPAALAVAYAAAGVAMAATVAILTGLGLRRMLRPGRLRPGSGGAPARGS